MVQLVSIFLLFVLSVFLLFIGVRMLVRTTILLAWLKGCIALFCLVAGICLLLIVYDYAQYERYSEPEIGQIRFKKVSDQVFEATLEDMNGALSYFRLSGDQWEVSVRFVNFEPMLGIDLFSSMYQWDRIGGRYYSVSDELKKERTVYDLKVFNGLVDTWALGGMFKSLGMTSLYYGSAVYLPMADNAVFKIMAADAGVYAVPANEVAESVTQQEKNRSKEAYRPL